MDILRKNRITFTCACGEKNYLYSRKKITRAFCFKCKKEYFGTVKWKAEWEFKWD